MGWRWGKGAGGGAGVRGEKKSPPDAAVGKEKTLWEPELTAPPLLKVKLQLPAGRAPNIFAPTPLDFRLFSLARPVFHSSRLFPHSRRDNRPARRVKECRLTSYTASSLFSLSPPFNRNFRKRIDH